MKKMIVASTSTLHGGEFLEYLLPRINLHFEGISTILFIPYARPGGISHRTYTELVQRAFEKLNIKVNGIHDYPDPRAAILKAEAFYVGGGNTFVLMDSLIKFDLMNVLKDQVEKGIPYLGTSAGSNITGPSIKTTNDMPIVHPPSLESLGLIPFNLNPHYLDPDPLSKHKGETRETRIKEFHVYNDSCVVGLREGSWIEVKGDYLVLKGPHTARIFEKNKEAYELASESDLHRLCS